MKATSLTNYELAQAAYDAVDAAHRDHPDQARLQDRNSLEGSIKEGLLFDVLIDGNWAGYIGAQLDGQNLGLPAYTVQDIILSAAYRGRGYGPHLTTLLSRALPDDLPFLVGTIHADNRGALTAALTAGRTDIGGWLQYPLTEAAR